MEDEIDLVRGVFVGLEGTTAYAVCGQHRATVEVGEAGPLEAMRAAFTEVMRRLYADLSFEVIQRQVIEEMTK